MSSQKQRVTTGTIKLQASTDEIMQCPTLRVLDKFLQQQMHTTLNREYATPLGMQNSPVEFSMNINALCIISSIESYFLALLVVSWVFDSQMMTKVNHLALH